jgi:hypothetical protein
VVAPRDRLQLLRHGDEKGTLLVGSKSLDKAKYWLVSEENVNEGCICLEPSNTSGSFGRILDLPNDARPAMVLHKTGRNVSPCVPSLPPDYVI